MNFAYEKEVYERWLTAYPLMEAGFIPYTSFKEYKEKLLEQINQTKRNDKLTNDQIIDHGLKIMKAYEKNQQKAGDK